MDDVPSGGGPSRERYRWVLAHTVEGDLRFISHRDTLRLFQRAMIRAGIPLRWSEGFNPHPRIMIPLPRPVGIASEAEFVVMETVDWMDAEDALARVERHTPPDIHMLWARRLESGEDLHPDQVRYQLDLGDRPPEDLAGRIRNLLESDVVRIERNNPKERQPRSMDIRPYLVAIRVEDNRVDFTLRVTGSGTAKPAEVAGLLGYDMDSINHRIRRMEIQWQ